MDCNLACEFFLRIICETPITKAQRSGIGKLMRPKHQKQSALKLAGRIIPRSGGFIPVVFVTQF